MKCVKCREKLRLLIVKRKRKLAKTVDQVPVAQASYKNRIFLGEAKHSTRERGIDVSTIETEKARHFQKLCRTLLVFGEISRQAAELIRDLLAVFACFVRLQKFMKQRFQANQSGAGVLHTFYG